MTSYAEQGSALGAAADAEVAGLKTQLAAASVQVADLTAQVAALTQAEAAEDAPPPPPPPVSKMLRGVNTPAGVPAAQKRWPTVRAFRSFYGNVDFAVIPLPAGVDTFCPSTKPTDVAGFAAGKYDAGLDTFRAAVHGAGIKVRPALIHEPDHKINTGALPCTFAQWYAAQQHAIAFFAGDPLISWSVILTANVLVNPDAQGHKAEDFLPAGLVSAGFDFDGSRPTQLPYVDYAPHAARMAAIKAARALDVWVPEFGVPLVPADTGGVSRAAWVTRTLGLLEAAGASLVVAFDTAPEGPFDAAAMVAFTA